MVHLTIPVFLTPRHDCSPQPGAGLRHHRHGVGIATGTNMEPTKGTDRWNRQNGTDRWNRQMGWDPNLNPTWILLSDPTSGSYIWGLLRGGVGTRPGRGSCREAARAAPGRWPTIFRPNFYLSTDWTPGWFGPADGSRSPSCRDLDCLILFL